MLKTEENQYLPIDDFTVETPAPEIFQTLPSSFNSTVDKSIDIETDHPQEIIELLGEMLGINDFRTNMATFWLLDTIALEVLRLRRRMSAINLAKLVSWLAGEVQFIQEKRYTREVFFNEMSLMFSKMLHQLNQGHPLMFWEQIWKPESDGDTEKDESGDQDLLRPSEELRISTSDENSTKHENSEVNLATLSDGTEKYSGGFSSRDLVLFLDSPVDVLEAIVESTYNLYGNGFHYATVYAAFAQPVEIHTYKLPYTLRIPRPIKRPTTPHVVKSEEASQKGAVKEKTNKNSRKNKGKLEKSKPTSPVEIPTAVGPTMTDDEIMANKRAWILPLMESNEASDLLEKYAPHIPTENVIKVSKIAGKKKGKRQI